MSQTAQLCQHAQTAKECVPEFEINLAKLQFRFECKKVDLQLLEIERNISFVRRVLNLSL